MIGRNVTFKDMVPPPLIHSGYQQRVSRGILGGGGKTVDLFYNGRPFLVDLFWSTLFFGAPYKWSASGGKRSTVDLFPPSPDHIYGVFFCERSTR